MSHGMTANLGVPMARKYTTYLLDATSTWDGTTTHKVVVPATSGQEVRWKLIAATLKNDANATSAIYWLDSSDVVIAQLASQAANTGRTSWPNGIADASLLSNGEVILDAGEKLHFNTGAAQGAGAYIYVHLLEVPFS